MDQKSIRVGVLKAVVGPPAESPRRAAKVGGEPPEWIQLFADGEHVITNEGKQESWLCDAESRGLIIAAFAEKGVDLVIDYEHQTLENIQAPASGWIRELDDRGDKGLWGRVEWTEKAKEYIRAGEYRYYSCVYDIDRKTKRVTKLHHVAVTNWPATHNINSLTEQIAAKARAKYQGKVTAREGVMNAILDHVKWWLNLKTTSTNNEVRTELQKILNSVPADDQLIYAKADGEEDKTVAELAGYAPVAEASTKPEVIASKSVLDELELPENATFAQVQARIGEIRTPAKAVDPAEHERVTTELKEAKATIATLTAKTEDEKINQLIASNRKKIPPAREPWLRKVAKSHGIEHAAEVVKNWKDELPDSSASTQDVPGDEPIVAKTTADGRPVNEKAAMRKAKVEKIMRAKNLTYEQANDELRKEEKAATA